MSPYALEILTECLDRAAVLSGFESVDRYSAG